MKTLYITNDKFDTFQEHTDATFDLSQVQYLPTTTYALNDMINSYLDKEGIDFVDLCVLDESSYNAILLTKKVIDNYVWKLFPSLLKRIRKFIVVDTSNKLSLEYGIKYLNLLKIAQQDIPEYKVIHITEWESIKSDYDNSTEVSLDFEASSLYPQQTSFYIGGVGLYDGKSAYYIYDNHLTTRLNDTVLTERREWVDLGNYLKDKTVIIYNLGYENKIFASRLGGVIAKPHDVLADLRCLVKSGSLKVTAPRELGVKDWADDVQHYVAYTNDLLSYLRVKSRGTYKWYKKFLDKNGEPNLSLLLSWYKLELNASRSAEVSKQFEEFASYLKTAHRGIYPEDILFEKGKLKVYVKDVIDEDSITDKEITDNPLDHILELEGRVNQYLTAEHPESIEEYVGEFSGKDFNIYTTLVKVQKILETWNVSLEDYEKLLFKLWDANEECKYTDVPLELCAKYCIIDTINTYNLCKVIQLEIQARGIEHASWMYQEQDILADRMERAGLAWDDKVAREHQKIYIDTALSSLKKLFLSNRGRACLKLDPSQVLEIETTTDIDVLKGYLNPSSYTADTKKKFSYLMVDKAVKIAYMYHELNTEYLKNPDSTWFEDVYPTLSKYYYKMLDMHCFYENYGTREETNENGETVTVKNKFEDIPEETMKEWIEDLRQELYRQADNFQMIGSECIETRSKQGFKFKGSDNEIKLEFELLDKVRYFSLPGTSAETIEWMYEVYTKCMGVNAEYNWTWTECFWSLYYFRMFKKVMKSNNTYIEGAPGREQVMRSITPHDSDTVLFDKFYNDVEDKDQDGQGWIIKSRFSANTATTKRWQSGIHTIPWKCLDGTTLLSTEMGDLPIKDLVGKSGFFVRSFDVDKGEEVMAKAIKVWKSGVNAECIKLTLENGKEIICTPEHRFLLTTGEWKQAQDLTENDDIEEVTNQYIECPVCKKKMHQITLAHIKSHGYTDTKSFKSDYGLSSLLSEYSVKRRYLQLHKRKGSTHNISESGLKRLQESCRTNCHPVVADSNRRRTGEKRSEECKAKQSELAKKRWEDGVYDREKLKERNSEFWKAQHKYYRENNPEWYNCRRDTMIKNWRDGKFDRKEIKGFKYGYYNEVHHRSSYEKQFLKVAFSDNRISEIKAEPWNFPLSNGSVYRPDYSFKFNGNLVYVEVKAKWKLSEFKTKLKYIEFSKYCNDNNIPYLIFTEGELWSPDVILKEIENACR